MDTNQDNNPISGPNFEPGPGWGYKVKNIVKRNKYFVIGSILIIILLGLYYGLRTGDITSPDQKSPDSLQSNNISETIINGDSKTTLARRALTDYLLQKSENLELGQKIFIENRLARSIQQDRLKIGQNILFSSDDLARLVSESKKLTPLQLKAWQSYGANIKF